MATVVEREFLGTVTLSTGKQVKVYMPTIGDIFSVDMSTMEGMYTISATACNMSLEEFKRLSAPDGMVICDKLAEGLAMIRRLTGRD